MSKYKIYATLDQRYGGPIVATAELNNPTSIRRAASALIYDVTNGCIPEVDFDKAFDALLADGEVEFGHVVLTLEKN